MNFHIAGVDGWGVAYHLEIGGDDLLDGRSADSMAGTFTMPDLGESARTVIVSAGLWWSDRKSTVKRRLEYLGPALPADPPVPAPAPASTVPAAVPQTAPSPAPSHSPRPTEATSLSRGATPESRSGPRQAGKRHATETQRSVMPDDKRRRPGLGGRDRQNRGTAAKHTDSKRWVRRTTRYLEGNAEPRPGAGPGERDGVVAKNASVPRTTTLAAARAGVAGGVNVAVLVPALLALAGLTLAGTAVLRRRRLDSPAGRD